MRVLIVTHCLGDRYAQGVERVIARLSTELVRGGDAVALATTWDSGLAPGSTARPPHSLPGVRVFRLPDVPLDAVGLPLDASESHRAFDEVLDEWRPEVVHITLMHGVDPGVVRHIQRRGTPVVLDLHSHEAGCPRVMLWTTSGQPCSGPRAVAHASPPASQTYPTPPQRSARVRAASRTPCAPPTSSPPARPTSRDGIRRRATFPSRGSSRPRSRHRTRGCPWACARRPQRGRLNLALIGPVGGLKGTHVAVEAVARAQLGPTQIAVLGPVIDRRVEVAIKRLAAAVNDLELAVVGAFAPDELSCCSPTSTS